MKSERIKVLEDCIQATIDLGNKVEEILINLMEIGMPRTDEEYQYQVSLRNNISNMIQGIQYISTKDYEDHIDIVAQQKEVETRCSTIKVLIDDLVGIERRASCDITSTDHLYLSILAEQHDPLIFSLMSLRQSYDVEKEKWIGEEELSSPTITSVDETSVATVSEASKPEFVDFEDIEDCFQEIWSNGNEKYFFEIAWNALTKAGKTQYHNARERAEILVYPYVLCMLNGEFSQLMFDEGYYYEFPQYDESDESMNERLTGASLGWLYCDSLKKYANQDELFDPDSSSILANLVAEYRYRVADPLFKVLNKGNLLLLLWYHTAIPPVDSIGGEIHFSNAKAYFDFCKAEAASLDDPDLITALAEKQYSSDDIALWMYDHSHALDN